MSESPGETAFADGGAFGGNAASLSSGAMSLLRDCVGARAGQRLLMVEEPRGSGYYDDEVQRLTAAAARAAGVHVYETEAPTTLDSAADVSAFADTLRGFDHVVFFSRVGDQLRFDTALDALPPSTMCYTLERETLDSAFGTACHRGLCEIKGAIDAAMRAAEHVHVTCPRGTDYAGRLPRRGDAPGDVRVKRFPMLVPTPVPAEGFSGRIVLSRFLVGTGSRFYEPYGLPLEEDVHAVVDGRQLQRFDGTEAAVARVNAHYRDIAGRYGLDPWCVHSWHAGIHPGCAFGQDARRDLLRWSGSAFGNPRLLHFHTCGDYAPGEISWNVVDPTVRLDGVAVWDDGALHPERLPDGERLLSGHPRLRSLYERPVRDIGLED